MKIKTERLPKNRMKLSEYIAEYIQEELCRGKTIEDIGDGMIEDAIDAYEGGAGDYI